MGSESARSDELSSPGSAAASERIRIGDQYYILASALGPRRGRELLNHGDGFAIFYYAGDIPLAGKDSYGLFYRDTRFLDRLELRLRGGFPVTLNSVTSEDGSELVTHLSNADEYAKGEVVLVRDTVALQRSKMLIGATLFERIELHNYGPRAL